MYKCLNCGEIFEDTETETVNAADYYGVDRNGHEGYLTIEKCPYCGAEEIEEIDDEG